MDEDETLEMCGKYGSLVGPQGQSGNSQMSRETASSAIIREVNECQ